MTDSRWEKLKELINDAMDLPREEWGAFLDDRCDDPELRDEVLRHLSEVSQLGSFLQHPERRDERVPDLDRTRAVEETRASGPPPGARDGGADEDPDDPDDPGDPGLTRDAPAPDASGPLGPTIDYIEGGSSPGSSIETSADGTRPTYELVEILGQGGFGVVYRAQQLTPVRRPVAIKYLRPEKESAANDLRFEAERQALASLSHPGIAKLLDAGRAPDGRQYFSMEYVEGIPLDKFCDAKQLSVRARLDLFVELCDAIQHAHFRGIIHRDLKPANVLAFEQDGAPGIRVIDLGLALATEEPLTEGARFLREGPGAGTPTFMSPEQWSRLPEQIDTRADIYSLGVILYHSLTGVLPIVFDREMRLRDFGERLTGTAPPPPSERYRALPAERRATIARARGVDGARLVRALDSDLDHICRKALAKEPEDRYASAGALADDIRRVFRHETVSVHPPGLGYQARKFVRRNRTAVIGGALILLTAVIGLSTTSAFWAVAQEERELSQLLEDEETVTDAPERLAALWPLGPDIVAPLEELRAKLVDVRRRRDAYERQWEEYSRELETLTGETRELLEFRRDTIGPLVETVDRFELDDGRTDYTGAPEDPVNYDRGLLAEVDWRLSHARDLEVRTRTGPEAAAAWDEAIRAIAESPRYPSLPPLRPQLGLLPLGADESTELHEFWYVPSGSRPEKVEGRFWIGPETGIVLVLVPGGTATIGSQNPLGIDVDEFDGRLIVTGLVGTGSCDLAGVREKDQIFSADGEPIDSKSALGGYVSALMSGGEVLLGIRRDDEEFEVKVTAPPPGPDLIYNLASPDIEGPCQTIELDPFFVSKFEITQGQWVRWLGTNPSTRKSGAADSQRTFTADQPVESMSWAEASEFCRQLGMRLPTEAQWEYCARAGTRTSWYVGDDYRAIAGHANLTDLSVAREGIGWSGIERWLDDGYARSAPVGTYEPNPFGLHDIMGNAWEWCGETGVQYWEPGYAMRPGDGRRKAVPNSELFVIRGGGYENSARHARSAYRWIYNEAGNSDIGLRPVRMLDGWTPPGTPAEDRP